jgi:hypothetical protein
MAIGDYHNLFVKCLISYKNIPIAFDSPKESNGGVGGGWRISYWSQIFRSANILNLKCYQCSMSLYFSKVKSKQNVFSG